MVYHHTGYILLVKKLLRHKRIENMLKYTQLIKFRNDKYDVAAAITIKDAKKVVAAGFDYVTEINGITIFRKPKRYVSWKIYHLRAGMYTKNLKCAAILSVLLTYIRC